MMTIDRSTYSVLEWLGDIGGLYDALHSLGFLIAGPFAAIALKAELLARMLRPKL